MKKITSFHLEASNMRMNKSTSLKITVIPLTKREGWCKTTTFLFTIMKRLIKLNNKNWAQSKIWSILLINNINYSEIRLEEHISWLVSFNRNFKTRRMSPSIILINLLLNLRKRYLRRSAIKRNNKYKKKESPLNLIKMKRINLIRRR